MADFLAAFARHCMALGRADQGSADTVAVDTAAVYFDYKSGLTVVQYQLALEPLAMYPEKIEYNQSVPRGMARRLTQW